MFVYEADVFCLLFQGVENFTVLCFFLFNMNRRNYANARQKLHSHLISEESSTSIVTLTIFSN